VAGKIIDFARCECGFMFRCNTALHSLKTIATMSLTKLCGNSTVRWQMTDFTQTSSNIMETINNGRLTIHAAEWQLAIVRERWLGLQPRPNFGSVSDAASCGSIIVAALYK